MIVRLQSSFSKARAHNTALFSHIYFQLFSQIMDIFYKVTVSDTFHIYIFKNMKLILPELEASSLAGKWLLAGASVFQQF